MLTLLLGKSWSLFGAFHQFLEVGADTTEFVIINEQKKVNRMFCQKKKLNRTTSLNLFQQAKYKVINKDQWCNILEFSRLIKPDLSNYDEDGACKCIIATFNTPDFLYKSGP